MTDMMEKHPELRNRAFIFGDREEAREQLQTAWDSPTMMELSERHQKMLEAHGEQDSKTIYAVVEDGEIGVMTEHHSVVKSYVNDSLIEGEEATVDVQTFEVDL